MAGKQYYLCDTVRTKVRALSHTSRRRNAGDECAVLDTYDTYFIIQDGPLELLLQSNGKGRVMKFIKEVPVTHLTEEEKRDWKNSIRRRSCTNPLTGKTVTYNGATAAMLEMLCKRAARVLTPVRATRQSARLQATAPVSHRPVTRSMGTVPQSTLEDESESDSDSDYSYYNDSESEVEEVVQPRATRQGVRKEVIRTIYYY